MNKSTKGALAAGTATVLLMGGVGTLAYWQDAKSVPQSTVGSGQLKLDQVSCGDWQLDSIGGAGGDLGSREIVPGDSLTKTCTYTITAEGDHLTAELGVTEPSWTGTLAGKVTTDATFTVDAEGGDVEVDSDTPYAFEEGDPRTLTAEFTVQFPYGTGADNSSQDLTATLGQVTLTVTQTDNHA